VAAATAAPASADPARAQDDQNPDLSTVHAEFAAACDKAIAGPGRGYGFTAANVFSSLSSGRIPNPQGRIPNLQAAVKAKEAMLKDGYDPIAPEIKTFQGYYNTLAMRPDLHGVLDQQCFQNYIAYLKAVDAPALELAKKEAAQGSAALIEQQRQMREAQQRAADESAAEQARQRKEVQAAAAQAEEEREQHQAAADAAHRKEAAEADAATLKRQTEETARAVAEAAEQKRAAATATALAKLKADAEAAKADAAEAVQKQHAEEQLALATQQRAEAAAKEEQERPAREAAAKAAQAAAKAAQEEAEKLPACNDAAVLNTVKTSFADSPPGKVEGFRVSGFEDVRSISLDVTPAKRYCSATMLTTAGAISGTYTIRWTGAHGDIWIEAKLISD
jgi:chemotaxis protein histidine kinase CheA